MYYNYSSDVLAIEFCYRLILEKRINGSSIYICLYIFGCQAAVLIGSHMVADCWNCLQTLSSQNKLPIFWVRCLSGIKGNELARAG